MNRIIKFRAWDKEKKIFVPQSVTQDLEITLRFDGVFVSDDGAIDGTESGDRLILSQFTGLLDKNGVEIFESDYLNHNGIEYEVVFENGCWIAKCLTIGPNPDGTESLRSDSLVSNLNEVSEIIGNIYSNPELLRD